MLDPFRTVFNDNNGNGLLENVEITALYKNPETEGKEELLIVDTGTNQRFGDVYTGGARWPRVVAGTEVTGVCDTSVQGSNEFSFMQRIITFSFFNN